MARILDVAVNFTFPTQVLYDELLGCSPQKLRYGKIIHLVMPKTECQIIVLLITQDISYMREIYGTYKGDLCLEAPYVP